MGRSPCCTSAEGLKKGPWTSEEDKSLIECIRAHGAGSWRMVPKLAGLNRCSKSCRLRWTNYLRPNIKRGDFSPEEDQRIIHLHSILGNKWSAIASRLEGRTDNEIKNYWNTHLRKKLLRMGIDPTTHKPRADLMLLASLPDLLSTAAASAAAGTGGPTSSTVPDHLGKALREQADSAAQQLAKIQLVHSLLQLLTCAGGPSSVLGGTAVTTATATSGMNFCSYPEQQPPSGTIDASLNSNQHVQPTTTTTTTAMVEHTDVSSEGLGLQHHADGTAGSTCCGSCPATTTPAEILFPAADPQRHVNFSSSSGTTPTNFLDPVGNSLASVLVDDCYSTSTGSAAPDELDWEGLQYLDRDLISQKEVQDSLFWDIY